MQPAAASGADRTTDRTVDRTAGAVSRADLVARIGCPDCRRADANYVEDFASGDLICKDCGCVVGDRIIDMRSEWRTFSNDDGGGGDPSRVGGPANPLLDADQLDTMISARDGGSGYAKGLIKVQNRAAVKASERGLLAAFRTITTMCDRIDLPKVICDRAKQLYKRVDDERLMKGKATEGIIAACIYAACREERVTRTFKEISALTLVSTKDIGRCYKLLAPCLASAMGIVSTEDFMARFCSHLNLNTDVQRCAILLARRANELGLLSGKSPLSVAAAGIYMVTQLFPQCRKSPKEISFVARVSEITIRNTYKDLHQHRFQLVGPDIASREAVEALPDA